MTEETFFRTLAQRLPGQVLYNADGGAATSYLKGLGLELPGQHWDMRLPAELSDALDVMLQEFGGARKRWRQGDLLAGIDGVVTGPPFGPCLVEVDTAEHFSPYRLRSLERTANLFERRYDADRYRDYCAAPERFAEFWAAVGLPPRLLPGGGAVTHPGQFAAILSRAGRVLPQSSQVRPVAGFTFAGGRIAQRAYHDVLIDCAHLIPGWVAHDLMPVWRVAYWDLADSLPDAPVPPAG